MSAKELKNLEKVCADYRTFISEAKTERECVDRIVNTIEAAGYKELVSSQETRLSHSTERRSRTATTSLARYAHARSETLLKL